MSRPPLHSKTGHCVKVVDRYRFHAPGHGRSLVGSSHLDCLQVMLHHRIIGGLLVVRHLPGTMVKERARSPSRFFGRTGDPA